MPTTLVCPQCGVVAVVHIDRDPIEVEYDQNQWSRRCAHPTSDALALCPRMRPTLQLLVSRARPPANGPFEPTIQSKPTN